MNNELTTITTPGALTTETTRARLEEFARNIQADNTRAAYASDREQFRRWCESNGREPGEVALLEYLTELATETGNQPAAALSTIKRRFAALSGMVTNRGGFRDFFKGLRNTYAKEGRQPHRAKAMSKDVLTAQVMSISPDTARGLRDRALLLMAYYGGFRSAELVALTRGNITETKSGLLVEVLNSKTDKTKEGLYKAIVYKPELCPVQALKAWLNVLPDGDAQPVFVAVSKSDKPQPGRALTRVGYGQILKHYFPDFSTHSMRAGFVTDASEAGANLQSIMRQTGHRTPAVVMGYLRQTDAFKDNAVNLL